MFRKEISRQGAAGFQVLLILYSSIVSGAMVAEGDTESGPNWWYSPDPVSGIGVVDPSVPPSEVDNAAIANVGQAMWLAYRAWKTIESVSPDLAAQIDSDLTFGVEAPLPGGWSALVSSDENLGPLRIGQLKAISYPFFYRLGEALGDQWINEQLLALGLPSEPSDSTVLSNGFINPGDGHYYPWKQVSTSENAAIASLAQLKLCFGLDLDFGGDFDGNEIDDHWELQYFGATGIDPSGDDDGDGLSNLIEFGMGTSPVDQDTDGDTILDNFDDYPTAHDDYQFDLELHYDYFEWDSASLSLVYRPLYSNVTNITVNWDGFYSALGVGMLSGYLSHRRLEGWLKKTKVTVRTSSAASFPRSVKLLKVEDWDGSMLLDKALTGEEEFDGLILTIPAYQLQSNTIELSTGFTEPPEADLGEDGPGDVFLSPLDMAVDSDRNGVVERAKDELKEEHSELDSGALYTVNYDSDGALGGFDAKEGPVHDAIMFDDLSDSGPLSNVYDTGPGFVEDGDENWEIENDEDVKDLSPLVFAPMVLPRQARVFLKVEEQEDLRAIHLFRKLSADQPAIWGSYGPLASAPWASADSDPTDNEIEITKYVNANHILYNSQNITEDSLGNLMFGIEGLVLRGMKVHQGSLDSEAAYSGYPGLFSGRIRLTFDIRTEDNTTILEDVDAVELRVAPLILAHNGGQTEDVFLAIFNSGMVGGEIEQMPNSVSIFSNSFNSSKGETQFMQDHIEIGYTQRPGGPLTKLALRTPFNNLVPHVVEWPKRLYLGVNKGVFNMGDGKGFASQGQNMGGNIEVSGPLPGYPHGRILFGDQIDESLKVLFLAQELQSPVYGPVHFWDVGHVDEVCSPGPGGAHYVPGSAEGIALLQDSFGSEEQKLRGVFFSPDTLLPELAHVWKSTVTNQTPFVIADVDYEEVHEEWARIVPSGGSEDIGWLRIVGAGSGGQVAKVVNVREAVLADAQFVEGGLDPTGKLLVEIEKTYDTGVKADRHPAVNIKEGGWHRRPIQGDSLICVERCLQRPGGVPAIITVKEVLEDIPFVQFNNTTVPEKVTDFEGWSGLSGFSRLPCLFQQTVGTNRARAYTPNVVNMQWVNGVPVVPRVYGPRLVDGENDVFVQAISAILPNPMFLDDWKYYHLLFGEVHCASAAERRGVPSWWANLED